MLYRGKGHTLHRVREAGPRGRAELGSAGATQRSGRRRAVAASAAVLAAGALTAAVLPLGSDPAGATGATGATTHGTSVVSAVPSAPSSASRIGALATSTPLNIDVILKPHHAAELSRFATAVSTPGSGLRGDYASTAELYRYFSPTRAEVKQVSAQLAGLGLHVSSVTPDRFTLHVTAPAGTVSRVFRTPIVQYRLASGRIAFSNTAPATLPAAVGSRVGEVIGLSDVAQFQPLGLTLHKSDRRGVARRSTASAVVPHTSGPKPCTDATDTGEGAYTADQLAHAYGMTGLYAAGDLGKGVNVGLFELEKNATSDISGYKSCYKISTKVTYKKVDGGASGSADGSGEAALDIEDIAGLAPDSSIYVYQGPNGTQGPFDVIQALVDNSSLQIVSTSWGECEQYLASDHSEQLTVGKAEQTMFELAAAEGQTWVAAAGDDGSTDCSQGEFAPPRKILAVDDPGSQPYVTSVGGTKLVNPATSPSQSVWNESKEGEGAGGGGISTLWVMPPYQDKAPKALHVINSNSSKSACNAGGYCREVPDVSADADPYTGYAVEYAGQWLPVGGTSAAAPLWAAATALTDASKACKGTAVGFLNPALYEIAGTSEYSGAFTDITSGNNDYTVSGYKGHLYPAGAGYDMASGLGTPLVSSSKGGLAADLCAAASKVRPGVISLSPSSGPAAGGNKVTVNGYGFTDVKSVKVGTKSAKFTVQSKSSPDPDEITVTMPAGSGSQWVTIENGSRTNDHTPGDKYTYKS